MVGNKIKFKSNKINNTVYVQQQNTVINQNIIKKTGNMARIKINKRIQNQPTKTQQMKKNLIFEVKDKKGSLWSIGLQRK